MENILLLKKNLQKSCNCDKGEKHGHQLKDNIESTKEIRKARTKDKYSLKPFVIENII